MKARVKLPATGGAFRSGPSHEEILTSFSSSSDFVLQALMLSLICSIRLTTKERNEMIKGAASGILTFFFLLCFVGAIEGPSGASASEGKAFDFREMPGWKQSGETQIFSPNTLYEYIDGAADLYLAYDFQQLQVAEYSNAQKASVTIELYSHRSSNDAFGVYSEERLPEANYLNIGAEGYVDKNVLNFVTETHYVKIASYKTGAEDREVLQGFAKRVAEILGEKGGLPSILSSFPIEGKINHSEKFIRRNFLGYSFLRSAFTTDYDLSGKKFKLFLMEFNDRNECRNTLLKYLQQIDDKPKEVTEGRYTLTDPHHGVIDLYWKGTHTYGILDLGDPGLRSRYLKDFEERLANLQP